MSASSQDSVSPTFAESKGFEPLHRINDDGLAGHYNTTLSTLHFFEDEERFELSTRYLTSANRRTAVELFIHFVGPQGLEP